MSFDDFWKEYPRKVGKGAARRFYAKALKLASHEDIMAGLAAFIAAEPWKGELQYCPHPATWLSQERWEDEYEPEDPIKYMSVEQRREHSRKIMRDMQYPRLVTKRGND